MKISPNRSLLSLFTISSVLIFCCFQAAAKDGVCPDQDLSSVIPVQEKVQPCTERRVLVVHSYHESQANHVGMMQSGVDNIFFGSNFHVKHFYMDTKRDSSSEWKEISGQLALDLVRLWQPELVIALDDNAQKYFARFLAGKKDAPLVVFSGVNGNPADYGYPAANVTGLLERPNIVESISLLMKIVPGKIKKILLISDDSLTSSLFHDYVKTIKLPVEVAASVQVSTLAEWHQVIDKYQDQVDAIGVYVIRTIKRKAGANETVYEGELVDYINKTTNLPTVGFFDSAAEAGLLCGVSVSMEEQGRKAALIALDLLGGRKKVEDIEISPTKRGVIQLNLKTAKRNGVIIPYNIIKRADKVIR
ncbi:MAG: hypothetical protein CSB24_00005 [Deltaproteobacteria bacterium]|nr:MAG: hypothetical protein CSB24_00005 [Deltaproteobacteria bacterium]